MSPTAEKGTLYGQHANWVYVLGTAVFLVTGLVVGLMYLPDEWSLARRIGGGLFGGLGSGMCIYGWRLLFYDEEED